MSGFTREQFGKSPLSPLLPAMVTDGSINEETQRRVIEDARKSLGMKESVSADKVFRFSLVHKINAELKVQGWKPAP